MSEEIKNTGVLTQDESARLEETYNYRKKIIEEAFKNNDVPTSDKKIEAINSVLNSMDKAIYDNVTARLKHQDNKNREAILDTVELTLKAIQSQKASVDNSKRVTEVDNAHIPLDTVPGETDINPSKITLDEITGEKEE